MHKLILLTTILLCSSNVFFAQKNDYGREVTQTLCSPEFHGRGYVNGGDSIAAEYLAGEFKKLGLKALSKKDCYFQDFTFPVNTFPGEMSVSLNGKALEPGTEFLMDAASSGGTFILHPHVLDSNVLIDRERLIRALRAMEKQSESNALLLDFKGVPADSLKQLHGLGRELAQMIPVIELTDSKFTWSVSGEQTRYPYIYVQDSVYRGSQKPEFELSIDAKLLKEHHARNVIGYLEASRKSKKTIVFTAHYDHLGQMGTNTYFPGGNDNASGTAMLLSLAKYYSEHRPDFNVLFIAFAGEEAGLIGSHYFTEHPLYKLEKMSFLLNLDIMGSGEDGITVVNATLFPEQYNALKELNEKHHYLKTVKQRGPAANSDHYFFSEKGVPAFFIYTMGPNKNYHDVYDTYTNLSFNEFNDIRELLIAFAKEL